MVNCDGPIEKWLAKFHDVLQSTLKQGLVTAVHNLSLFMADSQLNQEGMTVSPIADYLQQLSLMSDKLNNELVFLSVQIELSKRIRSCILDLEQGKQSSLEILLQDLGAGLHSIIGVVRQFPERFERGRHSFVSGDVTQLEQVSNEAATTPSHSHDKQDEGNTNRVEPNLLEYYRYHRIQSLILILNYYQHVVQDLIESESPPVVTGHCVEYSFNSDDTRLSLHVGGYELEYGYEFQSGTRRFVICSSTERQFVHLAATASSGVSSLCFGSEVRVW